MNQTYKDSSTRVPDGSQTENYSLFLEHFWQLLEQSFSKCAPRNRKKLSKEFDKLQGYRMGLFQIGPKDLSKTVLNKETENWGFLESI